MRDGLVEERERVAHGAFRRAGDRRQRLGLRLDPFGRADLRQVGDERVGLDPAQVETLAARQDRHRDLADLGGGEHELGVGWRLFQGLQERVEGVRRQHVDFVDDVDLVPRGDRRIADAVDDRPDVVDAGVRGGIHLQHIHVPGFHDRLAVPPEFGHRDGRAGIGMAVADVVEPTCQDAGGRRLADAANAGEHPGLGNAIGNERIGQGPHHGGLANQVVEILGAVLARQHPVRGGLNRGERETRKARRVARNAGGRVHAALLSVNGPDRRRP